jgi:hypothetical protein
LIGICENCGFSEKIENFNSLLNTAKMPNGFMIRTIYIECPMCNTQIYLNTYDDMHPNTILLKYGRIFVPDFTLNLSPAQQNEYIAKRIAEVKKKFEGTTDGKEMQSA